MEHPGTDQILKYFPTVHTKNNLERAQIPDFRTSGKKNNREHREHGTNKQSEEK
jgi:hypothetical protein